MQNYHFNKHIAYLICTQPRENHTEISARLWYVLKFHCKDRNVFTINEILDILQQAGYYKCLHHKKGNNRKKYKKRLTTSLNNSPFFRKDKKDRYWIISEKKILTRGKRHRCNKIKLNEEDIKTQNSFNKIIFGLFAIKKFNSYKKMATDSGFAISTIHNKIRWNCKNGKIKKTINLIDPELKNTDEATFHGINKFQHDMWIGHQISTRQVYIESNKKITALFAPNSYTLKSGCNQTSDSKINSFGGADSLTTALTGLAFKRNKKKIMKKKLHPNSTDRFWLEIKNVEPGINLYRFNKEVYTFQDYIAEYSGLYK